MCAFCSTRQAQWGSSVSLNPPIVQPPANSHVVTREEAALLLSAQPASLPQASSSHTAPPSALPAVSAANEPSNPLPTPRAASSPELGLFQLLVSKSYHTSCETCASNTRSPTFDLCVLILHAHLYSRLSVLPASHYRAALSSLPSLWATKNTSDPSLVLGKNPCLRPASVHAAGTLAQTTFSLTLWIPPRLTSRRLRDTPLQAHQSCSLLAYSHEALSR